MKGIISLERARFLELNISVVDDIFRINPDICANKKMRDLDNRKEYNWFVPFEKGDFKDGTRLIANTPSQAFNYLAYARSDVIGKNNNFGIYVSLYNLGRLRWA